MTMVLTVVVPAMVAEEVRSRYRTRVIWTVADVALITSVRVLRRLHLLSGTVDPDLIEVEAFIPEHQKFGIQAHKSRWVTPEYLRCSARLSLNQKSLREFFESGELEREV